MDLQRLKDAYEKLQSLDDRMSSLADHDDPGFVHDRTHVPIQRRRFSQAGHRVQQCKVGGNELQSAGFGGQSRT